MLVRSNDHLRTKSVAVILDMKMLVAHLLNINKGSSQKNQQITEPIIMYKG